MGPRLILSEERCVLGAGGGDEPPEEEDDQIPIGLTPIGFTPDGRQRIFNFGQD